MSRKCIVVMLLLAVSVCGCSQAVLSPGRSAAAGSAKKNQQADTQCSYFYYLVGKAAELKGRRHYEEAVEAYEKALVCDQRATPVMRDLAILLLRMGHNKRALTWLEKSLALKPTDLQTVSVVAQIYAAEGQPAKGVDAYQTLLKHEPDSEPALLLLGIFYARHGRYHEAKGILAKLLSLNDRSADGYLYLAKLYRVLQLPVRAARYYKKSLALHWSPVIAVEAADLLERMSRYGAAEKLYLRMIEEDDANEHARLRLAAIYAKLGKIDKAVGMLRKVRESSMEPQQIDLVIGRLLVEHDRLTEAEAHFKKMIADYPKLEATRTLLAMVYYEKGEKQKALRQLAAISRHSRSYAQALVMRVQILAELKDYRQAEVVLRGAIKSGVEPLSKMYSLLASVYQKAGRTEDARKIFGKALSLFSNDHQLLFEYGIFLDKTGDAQGAFAAMQKVLKLDPDDPYALNYVGYTWADKGIHLEKAERYLKKAVQQLPKDGFVRDSLGWVYFRQGKFAAAVRELKTASKLEPRDPIIAEHLGDACAGKGDIKAAARSYRRAIKFYTKKAKRQQVRAKLRALPVAK